MIQMDQDTWEPQFYIGNMRTNGWAVSMVSECI
jgi:hypothetical protein